MEKFRKIILLLVIFANIQCLFASESKEIHYINNTLIVNEGFEVEQLLNSNSQVNIGFIDKIAELIASILPNWKFLQKTFGTAAGHYIEKDGTEITYPMTLYDKTEFASYNVFRDSIKSKVDEEYFKKIYKQIYEDANNLSSSPCEMDSNILCPVAKKAKLAAFCYYMQLKVVGNDVLDCMRGEPEMDNFLSIALDALNNMNTDVPTVLSDDRDLVQWRSKELILYAQTYDFLRGAGVEESELLAGKEKIKRLAVEVYRRGKYLFFYKRNNLSLQIAGAIGLTAIVLNDYGDHWWNKDFLPDVWANAAHWNIEKTMWDSPLLGSMSEKGKKAGYAEGPHYFTYALEGLLPFFNTFSNYVQQDCENYYKFSGVIPNNLIILLNPVTWLPFLLDYPFPKKVRNYNYDSNWNNLYEWYHDILHPNGYAPSYDNGFYQPYQKISPLCVVCRVSFAARGLRTKT